MRRYIVVSLPGYEGGRIEGTVDDLDDIYGDDLEVIDTYSGTHLFWSDGKWSPTGQVDDIEIINVQRKSDPPPKPVESKGDVGGYLMPPGFGKALMGGTLSRKSAMISELEKRDE